MGSFRDTTRVPASRQLVYSINVDFSSRFLCSKYRCRPACRIAMSIAKKQTSCWLWMPCEMQMFGPLWRWKWWSSVIWQSSQRDLYHYILRLQWLFVSEYVGTHLKFGWVFHCSMPWDLDLCQAAQRHFVYRRSWRKSLPSPHRTSRRSFLALACQSGEVLRMCFGAWCVLVALLFFDFFCMYIYIYTCCVFCMWWHFFGWELSFWDGVLVSLKDPPASKPWDVLVVVGCYWMLLVGCLLLLLLSPSSSSLFLSLSSSS